MATDKKSKTRKVGILQAAMMGATTPTMGELEVAAGKKAKKAGKGKKESLLASAVKGATTPPMGKSEKGKSAAEKGDRSKKK